MMSKRKLQGADDINIVTKIQRLDGSGNKIDNEVIEIYKEEIDGLKLYCCPFCDFSPLASDIKFRKHLKKEHPTKKILLKDSKKPNDKNTLSDNEKSSIFSILNNKENQALGISVHDSKDADGAPLIVISENPLVPSSPKENDICKNDAKTRGRPLSAKAFAIQELVNQCFREASEEIQANTSYDVEDDIRCVICCEPLDAAEFQSSCNIVEMFENHNLQSVISTLEDVVGGLENSSTVCPNCEDIAKYIVETKESIKELQKKLSRTVSKIVDIANKGQKLLAQDLETGGICGDGRLQGKSDKILVVKIIEDNRIEPLNLDKMYASAEYLGIVRSPEDTVVDDGSSPTDAGHLAKDSQFVFCVTQHEWASGGLVVEKGLVHVPTDLIGGVALRNKCSRYVISRGLCEDLSHNFVCLDSGKGFDSLSALLDHSEQFASVSTGNYNEANETFDEDLQATDNNEDADEGVGGQFETKLEEANVKDLNQSDQYRIELRSYMHKEQFKDCANEIPTLDKPFQCKECNKTFERAHDLWGHHASFRGPAFKCNYQNCEEVFLRLPDFAVHYSAHGGRALVIPESSHEKKTLHITCPVCSTVVPGLYKLQRHKMKHDPELKYKCPACPKQFVKANTLRMHIANVHKGSRGHRGDAALSAHMQSVQSSADNRSSCDICGEIFVSEQEVAQHKHHNHFGPALGSDTVSPGKKSSSTTRKGKTLSSSPQCPECGMEYDGEMTLAQHFAQHHPDQEQRFQCSDCNPDSPTNVRFLSVAGARRHYRESHHNRPLICWVCKGNHASEAALLAHLAAQHPDVVGGAEDEAQGCVVCLHCPSVFSTHAQRVEHTRHAHLVETIDITTTDLDEVTMVGGHVIEFGIGTQRIVALHTIP